MKAASKIKRRILYAVAVLLVIVLSLATGRPQHWLLTTVVQKAANADRVAVSGISFGRRLRVEDIQIFDESKDKGVAPPPIHIQGLELNYPILPRHGRFVPALTISNLDLYWSSASPGHSNLDFLTAGAEVQARSGPPSLRFVPRTITINRLGSVIDLPTMRTAVDGLTLTASIDDLDDFSFSLMGSAVSGQWQSLSRDITLPLEGTVLFGLSRTPRGLLLDPMRVELPGCVQVEGSGRANLSPMGVDVEVFLRTFRVETIDLPRETFGLFPYAIAFDSLDLSGTRIQGQQRLMSSCMPDSRIRVEAKNLRIGESGHTWYEGDFTLEGSSSPEAPIHYDLTCAFQRGQETRAALITTATGLQGTISLTAWKQQDWLDLLPSTYKRYADYLPNLEQLSVTCDLDYTPEQLTLAAVLSPETLTQGQRSPQAYALAASIPLEGNSTVTAKLNKSGHPESGAAQLEWTRLRQQDALQAKLLFNSFDLAEALTSLGTAPELSSFSAVLSGAASAQYRSGALHADLQLTAAPLQVGPVSFAKDVPVHLDGAVDLDPTRTRVGGPELSVTWGEQDGVRLTDWSLKSQPLRFQGKVKGQTDLAALPFHAMPKGWRGAVAFDAPVQYDAAVVHAALNLSAADLVYGSWAAPYGVPITASSALTFDSKTGRLAAKDLRVDVGPGTHLAAKAASATLDGTELQCPFALQTDLAVLVDMAWLDSAGGQADFTGAVSVGENGPEVHTKLGLRAESIVLPGALAGLGGLAVHGDAGYANGLLSGGGAVAITNVAAAGALLTHLIGTFALNADRLDLTNLSADLYAGTMEAQLRLTVLGDPRPMTLTGTLKAVDLEVFTHEYKPPATVLTGLVDGQFSVQFVSGTLADVSVELHSDKGFSINRDLLQELLASSALKGFTGAKTLEGVMNKVIGKTEQRAFDRAELRLGFEGKRITGEAVLRSKDLNLTVDLAIDPEALQTAIELRQQDRLENVANIRAEPVQF